ncbi:MAG: hypothetical protein JWM28_2241 [Chitinophagaceae bacterium]|nr:hypothetical protein [Chitinophagaceae bacterium]
MDQETRQHLENLHRNDRDQRYASFQFIIRLTQQPVDWAYEKWDDLLALLNSKDNHERAIAAQLLSSLAKSDPEQRMLNDLDKLMAVTKDERFVTARHSLQSLWQIGIEGEALRRNLMDRLGKRFEECITEKNCTLIRYDIIEVFRKIYNQVPDDKIKTKALSLIETEEDQKYRKKYAGLWKSVS